MDRPYKACPINHCARVFSANPTPGPSPKHRRGEQAAADSRVAWRISHNQRDLGETFPPLSTADDTTLFWKAPTPGPLPQNEGGGVRVGRNSGENRAQYADESPSPFMGVGVWGGGAKNCRVLPLSTGGPWGVNRTGARLGNCRTSLICLNVAQMRATQGLSLRPS